MRAISAISRPYTITLLVGIVFILLCVQYRNHYIAAIHRLIGTHALMGALTTPLTERYKMLDVAISHLETATTWNPNDVGIQRLLGRSYVAAEQFGKGLGILEGLANISNNRTLIQRDISTAYIMAWQRQNEREFYDLTQVLGLAKAKLENRRLDEPFCWLDLSQMPETCIVGKTFRVMGRQLNRSLYQRQGSQLSYRLTLPDKPAILRVRPKLDVARETVATFVVSFQISIQSERLNRPPLIYTSTIDPAKPDGDEIRLALTEYKNETIEITFTVSSHHEAGSTLIWLAPRIETTNDEKDVFGLAMNNVVTKLDLDGYGIGYYLANAQNAFNQKSHEEAIGWLELAMLKDETQRKTLSFQASLAGILANHSTPKYLDPNAILSHHISVGMTKMLGDQLQWVYSDSTYGVESGDFLSRLPISNSHVGVMWWDEMAITVLNVQDAGVYEANFRMREDSAIAGSFSISRNFAPLATFQLGSEWKQDTILLDLPNGFTILGIHYSGKMGDALIDWIQLERVS